MSMSPQEHAADLTNREPGAPAPGFRELGLHRLLATLGLTATALFLLWTTFQSVFLALQVKQLDPNGAAGGLALVVGVGAIGALLSAPIAGALSDRTRTVIGGRAPWMLAGTVATFAFAVLIAGAGSITELAIYWLLIQAATNFIFTPITVHIPERVPVARRGIFSATIGISHLAGVLLGQTVGAAFAHRLLLGYVVVSVLLAISVVVFMVVNRRSNLGVPKPVFSLLTLLRTFWVNPVRYPNFGWTFLGRFLYFTGFFPLTAFLLYILQDYVGLGKSAVTMMPTMGLAGVLGSAFGTPMAGWLSDRLGVTRPLIYAAGVVMVVGVAVPMVFPTYPGMLVYSFLAGFGFGAFGAVDYVLITKVLPSHADAGKDMGIVNMTTTLTQTISVAIAGAAVSAFDSYFVVFPMAVCFIVLGTVCISFVKGVR